MTIPARIANRQAPARQTAIADGLRGGTPPYVSIEGGSFTLFDSAGTAIPVQTKHLDCIILDTQPFVSRVFWGSKPYQSGGDNVPPVCFSDNGVGASSLAAEPQSTTCNGCRQNEWSLPGQAPGSRAKPCKSIKKVAVLIAGHDFPFLLRVPVMSHENLRNYSLKFKGQNFDVSEVITRVTFVHGVNGVLDFDVAKYVVDGQEVLGFTDDDTDNFVQTLLDEHKTDALVGREDVAIQAVPATGAAPRPLSAPNAAGPVAHTALPPSHSPSTTQHQPGTPTQFPSGTAQTASPSEPPKPRGRPRKPPVETAPAGNGDLGIPPFLRRNTPAPAATPVQPSFGRAPPQAAPAFGAPQQAPQPRGGIVQNAPEPNAEIEASLQAAFGLKT